MLCYVNICWSFVHIKRMLFSSVQFSHSVMSSFLWPHGLQHSRFPCPSPAPGACSNSCPLSQWCHPTISSSVIPFSSRLQSLPPSGSFRMSQFFTSGGHSIGVSASTSVLPMSMQDWFPLGLSGLILPAVQGMLKSLLQHHSSKTSVLRGSAFLLVQFSHPYMTIGETIALTIQTFVNKGMSLLFNMLSRLVIAFLQRSKHFLISWLQSLSSVILEPKRIKSITVSIISPSIWHEVMRPDAIILVFWMLSFKTNFSLSSFTFIKRLFSSLLSAIRVVSSALLMWFWNLIHYSLGKYCLHDLCRSFKFGDIHYTISQQFHSLLLQLTSSEKFFSIWTQLLSNSWWCNPGFPKFQFLLKSSNVVIDKICGSLFSLMWRAHFVHSL